MIHSQEPGAVFEFRVGGLWTGAKFQFRTRSTWGTNHRGPVLGRIGEDRGDRFGGIGVVNAESAKMVHFSRRFSFPSSPVVFYYAVKGF